MINKQKLPLYIALAVPVLMILLVAAFIYLPGFGKKPKVNFLYITGNNVYYYEYGNTGYQVSGGRLVYTPPTVNANYPNPDASAQFYLYDVAKGQAAAITLQQAQSYQLDPSNASSDGYTVSQGNYNSGGDFFFGGGGGGDYNSWFIKGNNRAIKLNLKLTGTQYSNFRFLGWAE